MATAGDSLRNSHGRKAPRCSLMLPPCCNTPVPRVATPARGSILPRRYNPGSLPGGCPGTDQNSKSRRVSSLESSRYRALDGSILLWRVRCRKLLTNPEAIAEVNEHTVRLLGAAVSAERAWDPHIYREAFHNRKNSGHALFSRAVRPL